MWRLSDLGPALALLFAGLLAVMVASAYAAGRDGLYLVVATPQAKFSQTLGLLYESGGNLLAASRFPNVVIASSDQTDFAKRARQAGAWLVLPSPFGAGCSASILGRQNQ